MIRHIFYTHIICKIFCASGLLREKEGRGGNSWCGSSLQQSDLNILWIYSAGRIFCTYINKKRKRLEWFKFESDSSYQKNNKKVSGFLLFCVLEGCWNWKSEIEIKGRNRINVIWVDGTQWNFFNNYNFTIKIGVTIDPRMLVSH